MSQLNNLNSWRSFFNSLNLSDLWNMHSHSRDFRYSRIGYIFLRIRILALMGAIFSILWIPFEYCLLPTDLFWSFVLLRVTVAVSLFTLSLWTLQPYHIKRVYLRFTLLLAIPGLFYLIASVWLNEHHDQGLISGYEYFPLLLVVIGAVFPLTLSEGLIAVLSVFALFLGVQFITGDLFSVEVLTTLWLMLLLGSIAIWTELSQLHVLLRLYRQATRDPLTGLFNRRVLIEQLEDSVEESLKFSVLLFDLDRFKRINDGYGHLTGDEVLRVFSGILQQELRAQDIIGRYGGEEFLAVLLHTSEAEAIELAKKVRCHCHQVTIQTHTGQELNFTVSIGATQWQGSESIESLLNRVDDFLYVAKDRGRDCIVGEHRIVKSGN